MEFIWVIGLSAVGKRTFITKVVEGPEYTRLAGNLGLSTEPGAVIARGSGFWDVKDVDFTLQALLSDPGVQAAHHVLIKFQNQYDRKDAAGRRIPFSVVADLAGMTGTGTAQHRVIALWAEPGVHVDRYMEKHGNKKHMATDNIVKAMKADPPDEEAARGHLVQSWEGLVRAIQRVVGDIPGHEIQLQILDATGEEYGEKPVAG